ncbi:HAD family hydrolase [Actinomadura sp. HBU206391]|uniref:HAD family hydrolase n=1 Tax=Actinomadura sp. HBU206391 TaxID=2731692 RepID=UPI002905E51A|nr:HAD family hydrolase [Actinomadura sp. HBU206391]
MIFDVDGTLVDTNYIHVVTWWEAFRQYEHDVPMARVHRAIGMGSDKLLDHALPEDRDRTADDEIRAAHRHLYGEFWTRLRAFDGAAELLRACAGRGLKVVLASSASEREMRALRAALDAEDAITVATSSDDAEESKPAPDIVQVALTRAGTRPERAVFVGDTVWDVQACAKAGVPCVAVLTGGISRHELAEAGAVALYESVADLLRRFDDSPLTGH